MMRGVSAIVTVVILVALAVVAVFGVWLWMSQQGMPVQRAKEIPSLLAEKCLPDTNQIRLYNSGAVSVPSAAGHLYGATLEKIEDIPALPPLELDAELRVTMNVSSDLQAGRNYFLEYPNMPFIRVNC